MSIVNCQLWRYNRRNMKPPRANASVLATFLVLIVIAGAIYVFWQKTQSPIPAPETVINSIVSPPKSVIDSTLSIPNSLDNESEPTPEPTPEP